MYAVEHRILDLSAICTFPPQSLSNTHFTVFRTCVCLSLGNRLSDRFAALRSFALLCLLCDVQFCVAIAQLAADVFWDNVDCTFFAPTFPIQAALCENPKWDWNPTPAPTNAPTRQPTVADRRYWIADGHYGHEGEEDKESECAVASATHGIASNQFGNVIGVQCCNEEAPLRTEKT